jgi:hypothetical protein
MANLDAIETENPSHTPGGLAFDDVFLPSGSWYLPSLTNGAHDTSEIAVSDDVSQFLQQNCPSDFEELAARMATGGGSDRPPIPTPPSSHCLLGASFASPASTSLIASPVNDERGTEMAESPHTPSSLQSMVRATLNMEDVSPETLSSVMELLIKSRAKVDLSIK